MPDWLIWGDGICCVDEKFKFGKCGTFGAVWGYCILSVLFIVGGNGDICGRIIPKLVNDWFVPL